MIYFVSDGDAIKIGRAKDVGLRIRDLQCGSSRELTLIGTTEGGSAEERHAHVTLSEHRLAGEWFKDCEAVRDAIASFMDFGIQVVQDQPRKPDSDILAKCRAAASLLVQNEVRNGYPKMEAYSRVSDMIGVSSAWMRYFVGGRGEPRFSEGLALLQLAHALAKNSAD